MPVTKVSFSRSDENQLCSELQAYGISHKGKATSDVTFNVDDPPETYSNSTIQPRITRYVTTTREVRGLDFNPVTEPLDEKSIVRSGEGKMHGRYHVGDTLLVPSSVLTVSAVRSRDRGRSSTPPHTTTAHRYADVARAVPDYFCSLRCLLIFTYVCFVF
jgi:hypothetical protein